MCCYLDVVRELVCLNDPVNYRRGPMLLVGLTKPERLQGRGQTKRSTWSSLQLRRRLGVGLITSPLQNHSLLLKIEMHLPHVREALQSHHWNHESSNHQRQPRTSKRRAVKEQQATGYLTDGRELGTKMVKFQRRGKEEK